MVEVVGSGMLLKLLTFELKVILNIFVVGTAHIQANITVTAQVPLLSNGE
jgi:hypothetical protein